MLRRQRQIRAQIHQIVDTAIFGLALWVAHALRVAITDVEFWSPISNGVEIGRHFDLDALGAIVSKGTTLQPRKGNPVPRTVETPAGMINAIGFQNIGVNALISTVCPVWERWDVPAVVNIMGYTLEEYGILAARLDGVPGVAALEVNPAPSASADVVLASAVLHFARDEDRKSVV